VVEERERYVAAMLDQAREHYFESATLSGGLPSLGDRWGTLRNQYRRAIAGFRSAEDAIAYGQLKTGFDHRGLVTDDDIPQMKISQRLLRGCYPHFKDKIPLFNETRATTPGSALEFQSDYGPRTFGSHILFFHAFYLLTCLTFKPDIDSVCEIGGGYGNPCRLWFENPIRRVTRYTIIDIPESLFFAEVFLRKALPDVPIHYATAAEPANARPGVQLVPLTLSRQTDSVPFDIAINTGSMSEMSDEWVAFWSKWLDRQSTDLFYSHNMIGNQPGQLPEERASLAPLVESGWSVAYVNGMHPMVRLHSEGYRMAEIIFTRGVAEPKQSYESEIFDLYRLRRA
jgi:hypothetical protein